MVELIAVLPMSKELFGAAQQADFLSSVALASDVPVGFVYIVQVKSMRRAVSGVQITSRVAVDSATKAQDVAARLSTDSLNTQLTARDLPKVSSLSARAVVTSSPGPSDEISLPSVIGGSVGGFVMLTVLLLGGGVLLRRLREQAAYRVFVAALRSAKPGDPAGRAFTPLKLQTSYSAEQVLGKGAFGCVVKMRTVKGNQVVATKLLVPQRGTAFDNRERRQLMREAAVLELMTSSKCEHAVHLAGIEAVVLGSDLAWFVLEYLNGDNMEAVVRDPKRGPIGDVEAIRAARNVLAALKVMHAEGLVHRDIKPANIMRCSPGLHDPANPRIVTHHSSTEPASSLARKPAATSRGGGSGEMSSGSVSIGGNGSVSIGVNGTAPVGGNVTVQEGASRDGSFGRQEGPRVGSGVSAYKLIDFGTSLGVDERLAREAMMTMDVGRAVGAGTPPYMSPEMFKEPERAMYPTDLWSLGVSLFEMVTGVLPFQAESELLFSVAVWKIASFVCLFASICLTTRVRDLLSNYMGDLCGSNSLRR